MDENSVKLQFNSYGTYVRMSTYEKVWKSCFYEFIFLEIIFLMGTSLEQSWSISFSIEHYLIWFSDWFWLDLVTLTSNYLHFFQLQTRSWRNNENIKRRGTKQIVQRSTVGIHKGCGSNNWSTLFLRLYQAQFTQKWILSR